MFCEKCGTQLSESDKFCSKCGLPVSVPEGSAPADGEQASSGNTSAQSEKSTSTLQSVTDAAGKVATAGVEGAKKLTEAGVEGAKKLTEKSKELAKSIGESKQSKKMIPFLIAGAVATVLLIAVIANAASISNFFHKTFSSPEKYYQYVEEKNTEELASIAGDLYKLYLVDREDTFNTAVNATVGVELGKAGQDFLELAGLAGVDLSWLKSASFSGGMAINGDMLNANFAAAMNKSSLMSVLMTVDVEEGQAYLQIPELTNTYIGIDLEDAMGRSSYKEVQRSWEDAKEMVTESFDDLPGQAKLEKLLDKYMKIALDCVEDVDKKTKSLRVEGIEQKCTVLEVVIDASTVADMLDAILEEAEDDQALESFVVALMEALGEDGDDFYDDMLDGLENSYKRLKNVRDDEEIIMTVYVNNKGEVVGREIEADDVVISMLMPQKGKKFGYELSVTEGRNSVSLTGSGKRSGDKIDGEFKLRYNGTPILVITTDNLNLKTLKKGQLNGKMEIGLGSGIGEVMHLAPGLSFLQDMSFSLKAKTSDDSWEYNVGMIYDGEDVATFSVSAESKRSSKIKVPGTKDVIFVEDERDLEDWAEEINWDKFVANFERADMPRSVTRSLEDIGEAIEDGDVDELLYLIFPQLSYYRSIESAMPAGIQGW